MIFPQQKLETIIDSHCHLDLLEKNGFDIDKIVLQASNANVDFMQTICTRITEIDKIISYCDKYKNVFGSVGIHPSYVDEQPKIKALDIIKICNENKKIIGIGETGLDYFHKNSDINNQKKSFLEHINASQEIQLPLIIHSRECDDDMIDILTQEQKNKKFPALLHCFSSSKQLAFKAIDLDIFISISGIVTFKNAKDLQEIVKILPINYLLVETDSPYLAPMPHRGSINKPEYSFEVVKFIAMLKNVDFTHIAQATTNNFMNLFSKFKSQIK